MATFKPSDFARTAQIGHTEDKKLSGVTVPTFVADYALHYKEQKRTLSQQYQLIGTRLDETVTVITRHDRRNEKATQVKLGTETYDVVEVSPDDGGDYLRYDYFTLKAVKGHS